VPLVFASVFRMVEICRAVEAGSIAPLTVMLLTVVGVGVEACLKPPGNDALGTEIPVEALGLDGPLIVGMFGRIGMAL